MIGNWLSWHWLNIRSTFVLLFKRKVRNDIANPNSPEKISAQERDFDGGKPTKHEKAVAGDFLAFEGNFGQVRRMNNYFWSLAILCAIGYGLWHAVGAPGEYVENRGVDCPPDSGFWDCLGIYVDRFSNVPLLFLMGLILLFVTAVTVYEIRRGKGEKVTKDDFEKGKKWLEFLHEDSRELTPWWLFLVLLLFLLLEAAAITLIASAFVADFTRAAERWVGIFVGIVCASVLGWLVHHAGKQLYRMQKIKNLDERLPAESKSRITRIDSSVNFSDRHKPWYLAVSVIVVLGLVLLAFTQRYNLNIGIIEDEFVAATSGDLFEDDVPDEVQAIEDGNQREAASRAVERQKKGLIAALTLLSMIFVLVNFFGGYLGYRYSLYCDKSEKSYRDVRTYIQWKGSQEEFERAQKADKENLRAKADSALSRYFDNLVKAANKVSAHTNLHAKLEKRGEWSVEKHKALSATPTVAKTQPAPARHAAIHEPTMNALKASLLVGICLLLPALTATAFEVPFPTSSYKAIGKQDELSNAQAVLFVLMDETTSLNRHPKVPRAVQELAVNWLAPGRAVQVIRFSAYVPGRSAEIVTGGLLDPEPSDDFIDNIKRSQRVKFERLHERQNHAAKAQTTKAIRKVFAAHSTDIPKSEILFNMHRLSEHIRAYQAPQKVVLLVSDMLENSSVTSFYLAGGIRKIDPEMEIEKAERQNLIGDFGDNVRVYVVGLGYGAKGYLDSDRVNRLKTFWRRYFEHGNATVEEFGTPLLLGELE